jgi:hypothetical protein
LPKFYETRRAVELGNKAPMNFILPKFCLTVPGTEGLNVIEIMTILRYFHQCRFRDFKTYYTQKLEVAERNEEVNKPAKYMHCQYERMQEYRKHRDVTQVQIQKQVLLCSKIWPILYIR